jgi:hypothetical protein
MVLPTEVILTTAREDEPVADLRVTKEVLQANCTNLTLVEERAKAQEKTVPWEILDRLLLWNRRVVVLVDNNDLRTHLIRQIYTTTATAHPSRNKTRALLKRLY